VSLKDLKGSGPILGIYLEELGIITKKKRFKIAGAPNEIRTKCLRMPVDSITVT
jgi:hypothetical protein